MPEPEHKREREEMQQPPAGFWKEKSKHFAPSFPE